MADSVVLLHACHFAALKHSTQRRKDKAATPYINHPIGVAELIAQVGGVSDVDVLVAAVLHDTIEDTECSKEELVAEFGAKVANIVADELSDNKDERKDERKRSQIAHAAGASREAKLVKLADKLYNLRGLQEEPPAFWSAVRTQGYFVWSRAVVDKIRGTNAPMEAALDDVFAGTFPTPDGPVPCIPPDVDLDAFLEEYISSLAEVDD